MTLASILTKVTLVVGLLVAVTAVAIVGRPRLAALRRNWFSRLRGAVPYVLVLAVVLVANSRLRTLAEDLSWIVGVEITAAIYAIEGNLVPAVQSVASPPLTAFFSAAYIYGYVFVLVFPLVAYLALEDPRPLRETCLAYASNYALGLVLYVLFIAYGPRNLLPEMVDSLMYTAWPESQLLTSEVNTNTNVFPSLHASLSTTVVLLAYRTRRTYQRWLSLSAGLAVAIMLSTLYLGIHWGLDVLGGIGLGAASVAVAVRTDPVAWGRERFGDRLARRFRTTLDHLQDALG